MFTDSFLCLIKSVTEALYCTFFFFLGQSLYSLAINFLFGSYVFYIFVELLILLLYYFPNFVSFYGDQLFLIFHQAICGCPPPTPARDQLLSSLCTFGDDTFS